MHCMPDVFVSYARPDEPHAAQVTKALQASGYDVWRDSDLPAHRAYAEVIEERLNSSKAVLVLWSAEALKSQWVRAEADTARNLGKLIQASLDGTVPPIPFNQIQCASLSGSESPVDGPGWTKIVDSVQTVAGAPPSIERKRHRRQEVSICVLPFANMSHDPEQEYFSDGISEDITTDLSKVSALAVTARNTAFQFRGRSVDIPDIARRLGVSHVLEGSVRKAGGRVRINAQLIDGETGDHLWAERYDRDLTDIFAIQDEISSAIVEALKVKLLPEEKKAIEHRGTDNAEAYNFYLMARKYWVAGNYGDIKREQRVVRLCRKAIEIDSSYAQAWALMALAQVSLWFYFGITDEDPETSADRALAIDPTIAEAYAVKARIFSEHGEAEAANEAIARAMSFGPASWEVNREAARIAIAQRRFDEAAQLYEAAVASMETDYHSWAMAVTCYQALGNREAVQHGARMMVSQSARALAEDPSNGAALGINAGGHAILGNRQEAMDTIERAILIDPDNMNMRYNFACVLVGYLLEVDSAVDLLEPALAQATQSLLNTATVDPDLDPLRNSTRFQQILAAAQKRLEIHPSTRG